MQRWEYCEVYLDAINLCVTVGPGDELFVVTS